MYIKLTNPVVIDALRQHVRDNKNTVTNEYPDINSEVEAILYFYLIGNGSNRNE